ncbi:hypothetical protein BH23CHL2_BH23CHL2_10990 [soil metagenome]
MRKLLALLLVLMLVIAACGGDDDDNDGALTVETADTCEDVGDLYIDEIQVLLDELSGLDMAALASEDQPEALTNFEANAEEIESKSNDLGCSEEEMAEILQDRVGELEAEGPVAEMLLDGITEGIESGTIFE